MSENENAQNERNAEGYLLPCTTNFNFEKFKTEIVNLRSDAEAYVKKFLPIPHSEILKKLLECIQKINFEKIAYPKVERLNKEIELLEEKLREKENKSDREKLTEVHEELSKHKASLKHHLVITIENIIELAQKNNWGICKNHDFVYLFNGAYWSLFDSNELQDFFGLAAEKMGVNKWEARYYLFREQLYKQFLAVSNFSKPESTRDIVLINLKNGTFEIGKNKQILRPPDRNDFITYQLPFEFNSTAKAPLFQEYLNTVQPDKTRQNILAEYLAYLFIRPSTLKLEKTLLLYGKGANGKSVFFEIVHALLGGHQNVGSYSIQNLTDNNGYYRASLANKLVNYASEINGKLESSIFKQLVSGEPVQARLPYGNPFILENYAKLIFNCNELPKEVEQTEAFFRRFLIIPFEVTIPENKQDKQLSQKIIANELSGVFNWILEGLERLLQQGCFTYSEAVNAQIQAYKKESDNVQMYLEEFDYAKSLTDIRPLKELYLEYSIFCKDNGYRPCSSGTFSERLRNVGYEVKRKSLGNVVYIQKNFCSPTT